MSHFTRLKTRIRDKATLIRCLEDMGYRVEEGGTITGYQGRRQVQVAVRINSGYDVGFVLGADGCYELVADWWGVRGTSEERFSGELQHRFRRMYERVQREMEEAQRRARREYALKTSLEQLKKQGFQIVEQHTERDGTVRILARRWR